MYKFQFTDDRIEEYFYKNVIDPKRMSTEECIKKKLPYVDDNGDLRNTSAFMEVSKYYKENGNYPNYPPGSKAWRDFWIKREKRDRCTNGIWLGQVRITRYFYFFLNYHFMKIGVQDEDGPRTVYSLPNFWKIHFEFFHLIEYCEKNGLDIALIKPRGCGLSECGASICETDYFVPKVNPQTGKPDSLPNNLILAEDTTYLQGEGKIFDLIVDAIDTLNSFGNSHGMYKPTGVTRKVSSTMHLVPGYITEGGKGEPVQTGGSIQAKALKKADKAVGGRVDKALLEESGVYQELGGILKKLSPNTRRGGVKTGIIIMWGTSNTDTRGTESFRSVLKNPDLYSCVKFKNIHSSAKDSVEKIESLPKFSFEYMLHHTSDEKGVGWFIPYYDSYYMDDDGNSLRGKSYLAIMESRKRALNLAREDVDKENLMREIADHPITMEEALLVSKGRYFTNPMVSRQLVNLETGVVESPLIKGDLVFEKNKKGEITGVIWYDNPNGLIQILEHPEWAKKDNKGRYIVKLDQEKPWRLYIGGIDSVDQGLDDSAGSGSNLGCVIKKRRPIEGALSTTFPESYIALYNHRSHNVKHDYENILKLLLYFNAQSLLEYTKVRIRDYIVDEMGFGKYLAYEPDLSHSINNFKRKRLKKGLRATKEVILFYLNLITEYIEDNCEQILIKDLLEQIANYTYEDKGSYDLIAAMGMCEILSTEFRDKLPTKVEKELSFIPPRWYRDSSGRKKYGVPTQSPYGIGDKIVKFTDPLTGKIYFE